VNQYGFDERPQRALELLKMVGLEEQAHKLPAAVSTGQQQSAAIARALATDPPILVADEPTGNLDSRSASVIIDLFDELARRGKTIAMVTHDPSLTERTSRTVIISDGELVDETVALALPLLTHRQMLAVTRQIERRTYPAGATILQRDTHVDSFFMIASGTVEVVLQGKSQADRVVAQLGRGDFFGEIELLRGGQSIASIRATPAGPVELAALPRGPFAQVVADSPLTQEALGKIVQQRLPEHPA
jgi:putative ABC transport system ATP-binding protein